MILILLSLLITFTEASDNQELRLVSTVPSITNTIVYLGAEDNLVGISNFCKISKKSVTRIGSGLTPNYEKIYSLKPTNVLVSKTADGKIEKDLKKMGLGFETFGFNGLEEIKKSFIRLGVVTNKKKKSLNLIKEVNQLLTPVTKLKGKTFLWVISSEESKGIVSKVMIAGTDTHYHHILNTFGMKAPTGTLPGYHGQTLEKIIMLQPDYIFVSYPDMANSDKLKEDKKKWNKTLILKAVKDKRVYFLKGNEYVVPGPSILKLIKSLRTIVNAD